MIDSSSILAHEVKQWAEFIIEDEQRRPKIATERIVCPQCRGKGTSTAYLGDVTQWLAEDPDAIEDYMGGVYDRTCESCEGRNVIDQIMQQGSDPADWASLMAWLQDAADDAHTRRMESGCWS